MPRDVRAYLADVVDACDAIADAVSEIDLDGYRRSRLVRSAVEREFILIGEALAALRRHAPQEFASITHANRIVGFRNQLTHEYANVDDALVWGVIQRDLPGLRSQAAAWLRQLDDAPTDSGDEDRRPLGVPTSVRWVETVLDVQFTYAERLSSR